MHLCSHQSLAPLFLAGNALNSCTTEEFVGNDDDGDDDDDDDDDDANDDYDGDGNDDYCRQRKIMLL